MQDITTGDRVRNVYTGQLATVTGAGTFNGKVCFDVQYDDTERGSSGVLSAFEPLPSTDTSSAQDVDCRYAHDAGAFGCELEYLLRHLRRLHKRYEDGSTSFLADDLILACESIDDTLSSAQAYKRNT